MSANNPTTLGSGLFDVETSGKRNVKRDVQYFMYSNSHFFFWEVEMNSYHNVRVFTVSELIKQN